MMTYILCSLIAALTGLLLTARVESGEANLGGTIALESIAACVIAGVSLRGGAGPGRERGVGRLLHHSGAKWHEPGTGKLLHADGPTGYPTDPRRHFRSNAVPYDHQRALTQDCERL